MRSAARERVLDAAEPLFAARGYAAVTVQDIAAAAGLHHASLYHHIRDGGKQGLFVEVTARHLRRHGVGIAAAIETGAGDLRRQLHGVAAWLLAQPPMDMVRMVHADLPAIAPELAEQLSTLAFAEIFLPVDRLLRAAAGRGEIRAGDSGNIAGAIISAIVGLHLVPDVHLGRDRLDMADELIEVFIRGLSPASPT